MTRFKIAVDFDGTIVDNRFPKIGKAVPGAVEWLKQWSSDPRVCLMLWTMRSNDTEHGHTLFDAVNWCLEHGIVFDYVNRAPQEWTHSPKLYANTYIDDAAAGTPLTHFATFKKPCVDWSVIGPLVQQQIVEHAAKDDGGLIRASAR